MKRKMVILHLPSLDSITNSAFYFSVISKYYLSIFFKSASNAFSILIMLSLIYINESRLPNLNLLISAFIFN